MVRPLAAMQVSPCVATGMTCSAGCLCGGKACSSEGCALNSSGKVGIAFAFGACPMGVSDMREESMTGANGVPFSSCLVLEGQIHQ